nr:thiamine-phosphate kinase [Ardenticatena sp.]
MTVRIRDIGEFNVIERITRIVGVPTTDDVLVGIGDDTAVLRWDAETCLLVTIDAQVEATHFRRHFLSPEALGHRALAVNLSDIAAMGGTPWLALVSLIAPPDTPVAFVEALYQGMHALATSANVAIVGGNMSKGDHLIVDIAVLGRVARQHLLLRRGARPGDAVLVTGTLGDAAGGLRLLLDPTLPLDEEDREVLLRRFRTPTPRLAEAVHIATSGLATAMLDISDGLSSDIGHICDASHVGVVIEAERMPTSPALRHLATQIGVPAWTLALRGGEDYELCFTVPAAHAEDLAAAIQSATGTTISIIGRVLPPEEGRTLIRPDGQRIPLAAEGWRHF